MASDADPVVRRLKRLDWAHEGGSHLHPDAPPFNVLQDLERDDLIELTAYRSGKTSRLLVTLTPLGVYERNRLHGRA